jgi:hypothetical protein
MVVDDILTLIEEYGDIDGSHHKQWVLDQILRLVTSDYDQWVEDYERGDEYKWDTGIAP